MAYREIKYGAFKDKIKTLLRKRLILKDKIRYHKAKSEKLEAQLPDIEKELTNLLKKAGN